jgi:sugar/nucleoside kinase (ribokinase family)
MSAVLSTSLLGVSAQGWLRQVDDEGNVQRHFWGGPPFWAKADVLFVSDEDIDGQDEYLNRWTDDVPIVALTRNRRGAEVHHEGAWHSIAAFPAREVDPTGAGDVFAASFLIRYEETRDVGESMRFASAASACSIEGTGIEGIARRDEIEARMSSHPEIVLR